MGGGAVSFAAALLIFLVAGAASQRASGCTDRQGGTRSDGETYRERQFLVRCNVTDWGYQTDIVACLSESGAQVAIGATLREGGNVYACTREGTAVNLKTVYGGGGGSPTVPARVTAAVGSYVDYPSQARTTRQVWRPTTPAHTLATFATPSPVGSTGRRSCYMAGTGPVGEGQEMPFNGTFIITCRGGLPYVLACLVPGTSERVQPGAPRTVNQVHYTCTRSANGASMQARPLTRERLQGLSQAIAAATGRGYPGAGLGWSSARPPRRVTPAPLPPPAHSSGASSGDACRAGEGPKTRNLPGGQGGFIYTCVRRGRSWEWTASHCITPSGQRIPLHGHLDRSGVRYECLPMGGGKARLGVADLMGLSGAKGPIRPTKGAGTSAACRLGESRRSPSQAGGFLLRCQQKGPDLAWIKIACLTEHGQEVSAGQSTTAGRHMYTCSRVGTDDLRLTVRDISSKGPARPPPGSSHPLAGQINWRRQCFWNGTYRDEDEEWQEGSFIRKCHVEVRGLTMSTQVGIQACLTESGLRVPVDSSRQEGSRFYRCRTEPGGRRVSLRVDQLRPDALTPPPGQATTTRSGRSSYATAAPPIPASAMQCVVNGRAKSPGEEWTEGQFLKRCVSGPNSIGSEVVGCRTRGGAIIRIGQNVTEEGTRYFCQDLGGGAVRLRRILPTSWPSGGVASGGRERSPAPFGGGSVDESGGHGLRCEYPDGRPSRAKNEEWTEGNYIKRCHTSREGKIWASVVACLTASGQRVPVDTSQAIGERLYTCGDIGGNQVMLTSKRVGRFRESVSPPLAFVTPPPGPRDCGRACDYKGRRLCEGAEERLRRDTAGDVILRCTAGKATELCQLPWEDGRRYEIGFGEYYTVRDAAGEDFHLMCATFDATGTVEAAVAVADDYWERVFREHSYTRITAPTVLPAPS